MRIASNRTNRGFAIIIVMIVIVVLAVLAGGFALSMRVEKRLAANTSSEAELYWLGRSGVELGRYVLGNSMNQPYTSLNQIWAGGPGGLNETNGPLMGIRLEDVELGPGRITVRMRDLERRCNINMVLPEIEKKALLNRALNIVGVDPGDTSTIEESILDWLDYDDGERLSGTEKDFYVGLPHPYIPKNGPIDDLAELLLVRGVTPEMYWGPAAAMHRFQMLSAQDLPPDAMLPQYRVGLVELFTPLSNGRININTAPPFVLQLLPGVDENVAANIVRARAGPDGAEGTEDDMPFVNVAGLNPALVPGIIPELASRYGLFCGVISATFEITVDARLGNARRTYIAIVRRNSPRDLPILQFSWK